MDDFTSSTNQYIKLYVDIQSKTAFRFLAILCENLTSDCPSLKEFDRGCLKRAPIYSICLCSIIDKMCHNTVTLFHLVN